MAIAGKEVAPKIAERWLSIFPMAAKSMDPGDPKESAVKALSKNKRQLIEKIKKPCIIVGSCAV